MIRRGTLFGSALLLLAIFLTHNSPGRTQDNPLGPEAGRLLATELRAMQPAQDQEWRGHLKILGRGDKMPLIPVVCRTTTGAAQWTVTYEAAATDQTAAEKLTVIFTTNGPNKYLYAVAPSPREALGPERQLSGAEADIPFAGSDFWLSDLALEFFAWPDQNRAQGEKRSTRPCWVLESTNPHPTASGYSWVKTWVDQEAGKPLGAEAYGPAPEKKKLKLFTVGGVRKFRDPKTGESRYELKNIEMENLKTSSRTLLEFDPGSM